MAESAAAPGWSSVDLEALRRIRCAALVRGMEDLNEAAPLAETTSKFLLGNAGWAERRHKGKITSLATFDTMTFTAHKERIIAYQFDADRKAQDLGGPRTFLNDYKYEMLEEPGAVVTVVSCVPSTPGAPHDGWLFGGHSTGKIKFWKLQHGEVISKSRQIPAEQPIVSIHGLEESRVVAVSHDRRAKVFDLARGKPVSGYRPESGAGIQDARFLNTDLYILIESDGALRVMDIRQKEEAVAVEPVPSRAFLCMSTISGEVAASTLDGQVYLMDKGLQTIDRFRLDNWGASTTPSGVPENQVGRPVFLNDDFIVVGGPNAKLQQIRREDRELVTFKVSPQKVPATGILSVGGVVSIAGPLRGPHQMIAYSFASHSWGVGIPGGFDLGAEPFDELPREPLEQHHLAAWQELPDQPMGPFQGGWGNDAVTKHQWPGGSGVGRRGRQGRRRRF